GLRLRAPPGDVVREGEVEEVVAGEDEQLLLAEPGLVGDEPEVAHGAEPVLVRRRPVVVDDDAVRLRPRRELGGEPGVRDEMDPVDLLHFPDAVEHVIEHRPAAERQEVLRQVVGERPQPGRVAGGEEDRLHARLSAYGARWTPRSVTIAVISSAGVTSKAGLRAGKRSLSSVGSRSSIGIPEPSAVARSSVEVGATT